MTDKHSRDIEDDVVFEPEQEEGVSSFNKSQDSQVRKLKKQLKEAKEQSKENLDGWQRLKADVANSKQAEAERLARAKSRGAQEVLESILPALDSFDSAMQTEAWTNIDEAWRQGMEFVHSQFVSALEGSGITAYGGVGDDADPESYDIAEEQEVGSDEEVGKVVKVLRKGYKSASGIVRPARVVVGKSAE